MFEDNESVMKIREEEDPVKIKKLGYSIKNFQPKKWAAVAPKVMFDGMFAKFSQNQQLREFLTATGKTFIAEASPTDTYWGIGLPMRNKDVFNPEKWKGKNYAGQSLERVRQMLN